jgi:ABC-type uncharacterized transport system ATPase subunit
MSDLLVVKDVRKQFGALQALGGVDVTVRAGTFHGLIGPNGSGKSTLLKAIAGAHLPTSGTVTFAGRDITDATPYELSVYDNVLLALQAGQGIWSLIRSSRRAALRDQVMRSLERFRLADRADELAGALSHGEQQWLEIAMALAPAPRLLLLDEPTGGMSPEERRVTGELLAPIKSECALVIVEHDLDFIRDICDVLTVLDQGRVLDTGTVDEIQRSPKVQQVYTTRV